MRNCVTFLMYLLFVSSTLVSVQAGASQKSNLNTLIDRYSAKSMAEMHKEDLENRKVDQQKILYGDMDMDGDLDAIVELTFCETSRCDTTTHTSHMAVFLKIKGGYRFAAGHSFVVFRENNSIELMGKIESIKNGKINVAIHGCEVDDAVCLPRFLYRAIYTLKGKKFVMVRSKNRAS